MDHLQQALTSRLRTENHHVMMDGSDLIVNGLHVIEREPQTIKVVSATHDEVLSFNVSDPGLIKKITSYINDLEHAHRLVMIEALSG